MIKAGSDSVTDSSKAKIGIHNRAKAAKRGSRSTITSAFPQKNPQQP